MTKKILIILSVIITISPFVLLPVFYDSIPQQVPVFVDMKGNPTLMTDKSYFSVFRLPLMGIMTQVICFTMFSVKLKYGRQKNQLLWLSVSFLATLKMSITSMEVLIYENPETLNLLRTIVWVAICIAVVSIVFNVYSLYKNYNKKFVQYLSKISTLHKTLLSLSFIGYLFLVLFPLIS